jgi:hypothetical protein
MFYNLRKSIVPKLSERKKTRMLFSMFYKIYYTFFGPLHLLPDFYILGGQKCGTTSMFVYLSKHPGILSPSSKDIRFFDKYFSKGVNWYKINFPLKLTKFFTRKKHSKILTGEGTERYLDHPFAPQRIKEITPDAKFIILLRNPVDRAHSHYTMIQRRNSEPSSFEKAIEDEEQRITEPFNKMLNDSNYYSDIYFRHAYLHRGLYVDKIKRWMEVFPKEQFLIIQSEEFFKNPSKTYNDVLEFLGLPSHDLKTYEPIRKQKKSILKKQTQQKLQNYFKPHNEKLYNFLGKKFDWDDEWENDNN